MPSATVTAMPSSTPTAAPTATLQPTHTVTAVVTATTTPTEASESIRFVPAALTPEQASSSLAGWAIDPQALEGKAYREPESDTTIVLSQSTYDAIAKALGGKATTEAIARELRNAKYAELISYYLTHMPAEIGPWTHSKRLLVIETDSHGNPWLLAPKPDATIDRSLQHMDLSVAERVTRMADGTIDARAIQFVRIPTGQVQTAFRYFYDYARGQYLALDGSLPKYVYNPDKKVWDLAPTDIVTPQERIGLILDSQATTLGLLDAKGNLNPNAYEIMKDAQGNPAFVLVKGGDNGSPYGLNLENASAFRKAVQIVNQVDPNLVRILASEYGLAAIAGDANPVDFNEKTKGTSALINVGSCMIQVNEGSDVWHQGPSREIIALKLTLIESRGIGHLDNKLSDPLDKNQGIDKAMWLLAWLQQHRSSFSQTEYDWLLTSTRYTLEWYRQNSR
jgi:hypothetical protein